MRREPGWAFRLGGAGRVAGVALMLRLRLRLVIRYGTITIATNTSMITDMAPTGRTGGRGGKLELYIDALGHEAERLAAAGQT